MKNVYMLFIITCIIVCVTACTGDNTSSLNSNPCNKYNLKQYANSCEDLLITHEATGVIVGRAEYAGQYVIKVNKNLWNSTTAEQRLLIRCSMEEVAKEKGLVGVVIDNGNNRLN